MTTTSTTQPSEYRHLQVGDRVRVLPSADAAGSTKLGGRTGEISRACKGSQRGSVYVRLDPEAQERGLREAFLRRDHLELVSAGTEAAKPAQVTPPPKASAPLHEPAGSGGAITSHAFTFSPVSAYARCACGAERDVTRRDGQIVRLYRASSRASWSSTIAPCGARR